MAFTDFTETTTQVQEAWTRAAESWTGAFQKAFGQVPDLGFADFDPAGAIDRYFDFAGSLLEINRQYAKTLSGASLNVSKAVRDQSNTITDAVRNQAGATMEATREQVDKLERAERDQAKNQDRAARNSAADKYSGLTKAQLSEKLARRNLPRTGNVGQLRERLINADLEGR